MEDIRAALTRDGLVLLSYIVTYKRTNTINLGHDHLEQVRGRSTLFTDCFQVL